MSFGGLLVGSGPESGAIPATFLTQCHVASTALATRSVPNAVRMAR